MFRRWLTALNALMATTMFLFSTPTYASEDPPSSTAAGSTGDSNSDSAAGDRIFPHSTTSPWWISGQFNTIAQAYPSFKAPYSGANSLPPQAEVRDSRVFTLYTGVQITGTTEFLLDAESAGGHGLGNASGILGLTNADVVRNPSLGATPYISRLMIRQIVPLGTATTEEERGPLSLATEIPVRRLEFRVGKFSLVDFFDVNGVGSDVHMQFMNLTLINNAGYDYAADARGYTYAALVEFDDRRWAIRFAEALMPTIPNGTQLNWNLHKSREESLELEFHPVLFAPRASVVRLVSYVSHANRGNYDEAVANFLGGQTYEPDVQTTRQQDREKYGFGLNLEQEITDRWHSFARCGWESSQYESFEVNHSASVGMDYRGDRWQRSGDKAGAAFVSNGISKDVQSYLRLGGRGLLLGDGTLNYGGENIVETYYNARLSPGLYAAGDVQHVADPGYNRDRGPVWVFSLRLHMEF